MLRVLVSSSCVALFLFGSVSCEFFENVRYCVFIFFRFEYRHCPFLLLMQNSQCLVML